MSILIIISTPDALILPQDAYFYFAVNEKNYWVFWAIELYAMIFGWLSVCTYAVFYVGSILRLDLQFDILASRIKKALRIEDYINYFDEPTEKQEIAPFRDNVIHHQTIYT